MPLVHFEVQLGTPCLSPLTPSWSVETFYESLYQNEFTNNSWKGEYTSKWKQNCPVHVGSKKHFVDEARYSKVADGAKLDLSLKKFEEDNGISAVLKKHALQE